MEANIKVPEKMISEIIQAQIVETLSHAEGLIENTVAAMLNAKTDSYSRETLLQKMATNMIRESAKEIYAEWLERKKPEIKAAVLKRLNDEETFTEKIADKLIDGLAQNFTMSVRFNIE